MRRRILTAVALTSLLLLGAPVDRIAFFINAYDGGDCVFINPVLLAERQARLYGLSNSKLPFDVLDREFQREIGFEATINVNLITQAQCPALTFLSRTRSRSKATPRIDIDQDRLTAEGVLAGSTTVVGGRDVQLLFVADDGTVRNLNGVFMSDGSTISFEIQMPFEDAETWPQLLIAVVSNAPLDALKFTKPGAVDTVFAHAYAEALEAGRQLSVGVKYFGSGRIFYGP